MTDQPSNHWDLLASELGAEPSPEADKGEPAPATENVPTTENLDVTSGTTIPERAPAQTRVEEPANRPKSPTPDWDAVASELGVVPPPRTEEAKLQETPAEGPTDLVEGAPDFLAEVIEEPSCLVEDPATAAAEADEKLPARRRRKRRRKSREPGEAADQGPDEQPAREVSQARGEEPADVESVSGVVEPDEGSPKRRRRRRTSSRRKANGTELEEVAAKTGKVPRPPGEEEKPPSDAKTAKPSHRGIPTWEEAIGLIVSANLETRSKKSGGGSSRGRSGARGSGKGRGSIKGAPGSAQSQASSRGRGAGKKTPKKKG